MDKSNLDQTEMKSSESRVSSNAIVSGWVMGLPLVLLFVASFAFHKLGGFDIGISVAIGAVIASIGSLFVYRKIAVVFLILGVLTWSSVKSDIDPLLIYSNRGRAVEYVFGRSLSEDEKDRILVQAERTALLSLRSDAERLVGDDLGFDRGAILDDATRVLIEEEASRIRSVLSDDEWNARVIRSAKRAEDDRKGGFFPIEKSPKSLALYFDAIFETIAIAIWGTLIAFLIALPVSLFASSRTFSILSSGDGIGPRVVRHVGTFFTRRCFDACRGFNEFVLALIFVAVIGLGPFAGVLALAVHTFGVLGKVFADALDTIRQGEVEGVSASGASAAHVISFAVLPQVFPIVISQTLLRFESNVRSASVLGLVGAGGIGFLIDAKLKAYQFQEVATIMLIIIILVSLIDFGCSRVVKRFV